jgi:hypothetical protein
LVFRVPVDIRWGPHLLDATLVDDDDLVAHGHGFQLVMGDVYHSNAQLLLDFLDYNFPNE